MLNVSSTPLLIALGLGLALTGCGSKGAVALTAYVESPALAVEQGALGSTLSGRFDLVLELGSSAPRGTEVSLGVASIQRGDTVLVEPLSTSADASFPLTVEVGGSETVRFTLEDGEILEAGLDDELCSGEVVIAGAVTDTLSEGKPTPFSSSGFSVDCP